MRLSRFSGKTPDTNSMNGERRNPTRLINSFRTICHLTCLMRTSGSGVAKRSEENSKHSSSCSNALGACSGLNIFSCVPFCLKSQKKSSESLTTDDHKGSGSKIPTKVRNTVHSISFCAVEMMVRWMSVAGIPKSDLDRGYHDRQLSLRILLILTHSDR